MRVIEAELGEVRTIAISPDGRFIAASGAGWCTVFRWATGEIAYRNPLGVRCEQFAFGSNELAYTYNGSLRFDRFNDEPVVPLIAGKFAGGLAVSPDGKTLVAATTNANRAKLERWALPALKPIMGFDDCQPFSRIAFSPNGEFLAGISSSGFEVRFARTGGIDYRHRMPRGSRFTVPGFVSFDRHSSKCAFGWESEFYVLDTSTGTSKLGPRIEAQFRDAAFLPSGQHFATIGDDGFLKLWNPETWKVAREYDWNCGPLTALAFSADGSGGVCGTADGRLIQFDVDE